MAYPAGLPLTPQYRERVRELESLATARLAPGFLADTADLFRDLGVKSAVALEPAPLARVGVRVGEPHDAFPCDARSRSTNLVPFISARARACGEAPLPGHPSEVERPIDADLAADIEKQARSSPDTSRRVVVRGGKTIAFRTRDNAISRRGARDDDSLRSRSWAEVPQAPAQCSYLERE